MKRAQKQRLRVGTRGSMLAMTQTRWVVAQMQRFHPALEVVIEIIQTTGDMRRDVSFAQVGTKGMFVKEIEQALLSGAIDVGVHSMKDMPGLLPEDLSIACIPAREDPRDALIAREGITLDSLSQDAIVGTSSLRRQALLRAYRPDLKVKELRGNLDTRLRKLEEGHYEAIMLACAGLNRLGLQNRITQRLSPAICMPAVGQGALALEIRTEDQETRTLLSPLHDLDTEITVTAERAFQAALNGGCTIPAGALATLLSDQLSIEGVIAATDGSTVLREQAVGLRSEACLLGSHVAERLLARGGAELLKGERTAC
jgi:hydroxymethylbilane synthase